jgi:hypothetical protein
MLSWIRTKNTQEPTKQTIEPKHSPKKQNTTKDDYSDILLDKVC